MTTPDPIDQKARAEVAEIAAPEQTIPDWEALKVAINTAIWMHAPSTLTLGQADKASCLAIEYIAKCYNEHN